MANALRFQCPACGIMVEVSSDQAGTRLTCGGCKRQIIAPVPARLATVLEDCKPCQTTRRSSAELETGTLGREFNRWRYWAAQVRDRSGAYQQIQPADAEIAGILVKLMDACEAWRKRAEGQDSSRTVVEGLESNMASLINMLLAHGITPPDPA